MVNTLKVSQTTRPKKKNQGHPSNLGRAKNLMSYFLCQSRRDPSIIIQTLTHNNRVCIVHIKSRPPNMLRRRQVTLLRKYVLGIGRTDVVSGAEHGKVWCADAA